MIKPFNARELLARVGGSIALSNPRPGEAALRESEERFRNMADHAPVMIWVTEADGSCSFLSKSWYDFTGQKPDAGLAFGWVEALHPDDRAPVQAKFLRANDAPQAFRMEYRLRRSDDNDYRWALSAATPRYASKGEFLGYIGSVIDITERKQAEEALRENELKLRQQADELEQQLIASGRLVSIGEITASMAHEFNNPLGVIMGFVEDILDDMDPADPNYRALKIIDEESKRCQKIISDLMEYTRPRAIDLNLTSVKSTVEKTLHLIENRLYKQKVTVVRRLNPDLPRIYADSRQLEQVLINLYLNAVDAMPAGGRLTVETRPESMRHDGATLLITISDTGFGIDEKDLNRIFQPFFTAKKRTGLGLGLPVCARIIKNHGGSIAVDSRPGQGTSFSIRLPMNRQPNPDQK